MDERVEFITAYRGAEESMAALCRRYGISRKTGYKWVARYEATGFTGLAARARRPRHCPHAVTGAVQEAILAARHVHPRWGPRKLRAWLGQRQPGPRWPAASTIGALLHRHGLAVPRRRRARVPPPLGAATGALAPNDVWATDFKGWFRTGDGQRCEPFTLSDGASRFLLRCQPVARGDAAHVRPLLEAAFREYGLPRVLRSDNGPPFASVAAGGLSRLAVWWIKLGITPERIRPGHPEDNGRHERLPLTLRLETASPPAATLRAQQQRFLRFQHEYNYERPHEALGQRPPAAVYTPAPRPYPARLPVVSYPAASTVRYVHPNGEITWQQHRVFISQCLAGEHVGLAEEDDGAWRVYFGPIALGWLEPGHPTLRRPRQ
jgi:transposase InsO family protein